VLEIVVVLVVAVMAVTVVVLVVLVEVIVVVLVVVVVVVPQFSAGIGSGSKRPYLKAGGYTYFTETCHQSNGHHLPNYSFFKKYFERKILL